VNQLHANSVLKAYEYFINAKSAGYSQDQVKTVAEFVLLPLDVRWTFKALIEKTQLSKRAIYRIIKKLVELGFEYTGVKSGFLNSDDCKYYGRSRTYNRAVKSIKNVMPEFDFSHVNNFGF